LLLPSISSGITPGISGERQHKIHEGNAVARVRCMPLLCRRRSIFVVPPEEMPTHVFDPSVATWKPSSITVVVEVGPMTCGSFLPFSVFI
jgi:hypothetical protein